MKKEDAVNESLIADICAGKDCRAEAVIALKQDAKTIQQLRDALRPFTLKDAPVYEDTNWCDFRIKAELVRNARAAMAASE